VPKAVRTVGSILATRSSGEMSKENLHANRTARSSLKGSSCSVIRAGRGVQIIPGVLTSAVWCKGRGVFDKVIVDILVSILYGYC
jgi:hypothetical protein